MDTDLVTLKKPFGKDTVSLLQKWTTSQEDLLAEWSEKAACFRWLHSRSEKRYRCRNYSFTIPVIILSTLTGTANFAMDSFVPDEHKQMAMACVGGVNIFAGILSTLQNFLRYAELMESHRLCEIQWSKFGRNISVELALDPSRRKPANDFLKVCRSEYDRLIEQSPPIDDPIIKQFKRSFRKTDIRKPDICNGLHKCKIYEPSPDEKLGTIMANAGSKLIEKRKCKKWSDPMIETELKSLTRKSHVTAPLFKKESDRELDELKHVCRVSSFKNKNQDIENPTPINPIEKSVIITEIEENIDMKEGIGNNKSILTEPTELTELTEPTEIDSFLKGIDDN